MPCPSCGRDNAPDSRFCSNCGAPLGQAEPTRRERKVVTVLFADLVGSTRRAEQLDPEEVDAELRAYHARVRAELERYGGTVEKFIGDAVVALFGAPVTHEDDAERAVRAALGVRDWAAQQDDLHVRIAVNTGEALVTLDAHASGGEGMATGDVLNTASRLQSAAPVNGVLVGEQTFRATERVIEYREHDPVDAKGKAEPVPVWEAVAARSRLGVDVSQESRAPLVGRGRERELLAGTLHRVVDEREPQLVTLVGVPGIGKSRLVYELLEVVDAADELIYWRQGRCLPYGEGVAFWAFGEMVKAQAGILETDSAEEAQRKLAETVNDLCKDDAAWVERSLRPLVGLATESGQESREEAFAAWRSLVEAMADQRPTVLVFEDLHWADEGLLDFIDHLVDWSTGTPLLCVCTARPELLERRPGWGGGKLNSTTIALSPLSDEDTHQLLARLLGRSALPAELLQFAGGNPLYAEEYARMLADRGLDESALPETVQGIIAARLDALSAEEKTTLQNGAVFGKVFWSGSLAALDGADSNALRAPLHGLVRKEFVRPERRSSVGGQDEYAFRHVLVRDVAYGQIPRAERAAKHRRAAEWIESLSERGDDLADLLAHHYVSALEYGAERLGKRAARALADAGDRAAELHSYRPAIRYYRAALELLSEDEREARGEALLSLGRMLFNADAPLGAEELRSAIKLLEHDRPDLAADGLTYLALIEKGDQQQALAHLERAVELVRDEPPTRGKATAFARLGSQLTLSNRYGRAIELVRTALEVSKEIGDRGQQADALLALGQARLNLGEPEGLDDMEQALALAQEANARSVTQHCFGNLADSYASHRCDLVRCWELQAAGRLVDGASSFRRFFEGERVTELYFRGQWDEAVAAAEMLLAELARSGSTHFIQTVARSDLARVAVGRADDESAARNSEIAVELGRAVGDLQVRYLTLASRAVVLLELGREAESKATVSEFVEDESAELARTGNAYIPWEGRLILAWLCTRYGYGAEFARFLDETPRWQRPSPWVDMMRAVLAGDIQGAASMAEDRLVLAEAAFLRLKAGVDVDRALAFYRAAGATRYIGQAEKLIAA